MVVVSSRWHHLGEFSMQMMSSGWVLEEQVCKLFPAPKYEQPDDICTEKLLQTSSSGGVFLAGSRVIFYRGAVYREVRGAFNAVHFDVLTKLKPMKASWKWVNSPFKCYLKMYEQAVNINNWLYVYLLWLKKQPDFWISLIKLVNYLCWCCSKHFAEILY